MGKADVLTGLKIGSIENLILLKKFGSGSREKFEDRTATGNPVIFTTNFAQNAKALSVDFAPKQDLNGYSKPWAKGAGENIAKVACNLDYDHGVAIVYNNDGSIYCNGTATGQDSFSSYGPTNSAHADKEALKVFPAGTYTLKTYSGKFYVMFRNGTNTAQLLSPRVISEGSTYTFTVEEPIIIYSRTYVNKDSTVNKVFKFGTYIGDTAPADWIPYANICTINGIDSVDVVANSNTHEFDLGRTVYGGGVSASDGVLTVTDALIASYNGESLPSTWISDRDEYKTGAIPTIGAQVVYKLAEPLTYQLTTQQIALIEGENVIATDGDNLNVTYQVKV